eukprot:CAMPEP_0116034800 /NCGR_PEP_ID=MMETSP0321-20121206/19890_1 /TAXON_ID=163516 /ORGANISM="Leptocylindrus danicus var. danicus, Strain B650" /LENGTH=336 /DNA_ID=CAMNT_0003511315 /DNA_START=93 /DNA_END=1103 /DNA_ORIENTATION=+
MTAAFLCCSNLSAARIAGDSSSAAAASRTSAAASTAAQQQADSNNNIGVPPVIIHGQKYHINDKSPTGSTQLDTVNYVENCNLLEIPCRVIGKRKGTLIKAFVDTGAQVTVMSLDAVRRCGLERELDYECSGRAVGVGSTRIVGRLDNVRISLSSNAEVTCKKIVVIEDTFMSDLDLLLGLDVLTELGASICLRERTLKIQVEDINSKGVSTKSIRFLDYGVGISQREGRTQSSSSSSSTAGDTNDFERVRKFAWDLPKLGRRARDELPSYLARARDGFLATDENDESTSIDDVEEDGEGLKTYATATLGTVSDADDCTDDEDEDDVCDGFDFTGV